MKCGLRIVDLKVPYTEKFEHIPDIGGSKPPLYRKEAVRQGRND
jgi:hypothetical protein